MRVALVHNASAGVADYKTRDLLALLRLAGHEASAIGRKPSDIAAAIAAQPDVMIAAGGDGTVALVAIAIHEAGADVPLAILPVGTSNNIARSLGVSDDAPAIVFALDEARATRFDIGVVRAARTATHFAESAGIGFIGTMLEQGSTIRGRLARRARTLRGSTRKILRRRDWYEHGVARLVRSAKPFFNTVIADGEDLSGEYVAVVAMNIARVGPRIVLAPEAATDDSLLDLVLVRPDERSALADHVEFGKLGRPPGVMRRVRRVAVSWPRRGGHVDDEPWPGSDERDDMERLARIEIAGAIHVLL